MVSKHSYPIDIIVLSLVSDVLHHLYSINLISTSILRGRTLRDIRENVKVI